MWIALAGRHSAILDAKAQYGNWALGFGVGVQGFCRKGEAVMHVVVLLRFSRPLGSVRHMSM